MNAQAEYDMKRINEIIAHKQFELQATGSLVWWFLSQRSLRAAQVLFRAAKNAHSAQLELTKQELLNGDGSPSSSSRPMTAEEYVLGIDMDLLAIACFHLARALELLFKGILIERNADQFLVTMEDGTLRFDGHQLNHDLLACAERCGIELSDLEWQYLAALTTLLNWGLFPIPLKEKILRDDLNARAGRSFSFNINTFPNIAQLYDKILSVLNTDRIGNGRLAQHNILWDF